MLDPKLTYLRINKRMVEVHDVPAEDHLRFTPREIVPEIADQAKTHLRQV